MMPPPLEIRYRSETKTLTVTFADDKSLELPAELLRVESPSAEVRGHGSETKKLVSGKRHVGITEIIPVGHYAVRLVFDDLHDSGIFSWTYLRWLGENRETIWGDYLKALQLAGRKRDPF